MRIEPVVHGVFSQAAPCVESVREVRTLVRTRCANHWREPYRELTVTLALISPFGLVVILLFCVCFNLLSGLP